MKSCVARHPSSIPQLDCFESTAGPDESSDRGTFNVNLRGDQPASRLVVNGVGEEGDLGRPAAQHHDERTDVRHGRIGSVVPPATAAHLPAVAIRTLEHRMAPKRLNALDPRQLIDDRRVRASRQPGALPGHPNDRHVDDVVTHA